MPFRETINRLTANRLSYSQARAASKLGLLASFFMLFKSTVGLGLFSNPYIYAKVGIGYAIIFGLFICYISTYGLYVLAKLSNLIEATELIQPIPKYDGINILLRPDLQDK